MPHKCPCSTINVESSIVPGSTVTFARRSLAMVRPLVLCGPSGSGKATIMKRLTDEFPTSFGFSVSHTTRGPRPGESEGVHYHYVSREAMAEAIEDGQFIETAEFSGNVYGTSRKAVQTVLGAGKICILDIEMQVRKR